MVRKMLSYSEAAEKLGVKLGTLYSMVSGARVPFVRLGPRLVRFPEDELDRWLHERLVMPASEQERKAS